jgi:hypothetical protein
MEWDTGILAATEDKVAVHYKVAAAVAVPDLVVSVVMASAAAAPAEMVYHLILLVQQHITQVEVVEPTMVVLLVLHTA